MELVYASLLLHNLGKEITEESVEKVLEAAGAKPDKARVKALVSSLKEINIDEAIKQTAFMPATGPAPQAPAEAKPKEEKKEDEEKKAEEAAAGLGSLFG